MQTQADFFFFLGEDMEEVNYVCKEKVGGK